MTKLTDEQVLRIGAEQAERYSLEELANGDVVVYHKGQNWFWRLNKLPQCAIAGIADQLRTQVNAMDGCDVVVWSNSVDVTDYRNGVERHVVFGSTAMDQIRCIVEWGGLEGGE